MAIRESIERSSKPRSGIAIGGIGAGTLELRKDGIFRNWSIFNNEPMFGGPRFAFPEDSSLFFLVRYQVAGGHPQMKLLQIDEGDHPAGALLQFYTFPWMSGVDRIDYEGSFPFTRLRFEDAELPFEISLEAVSPFIPGDVRNSSLPAAVFRFHVRSRSQQPVDVLLMTNLRHVVGYADPGRAYAGTVVRDADALLVEHHCDHMDQTDPTWGQMVLASCDSDSSYHAGWSHRHTFHEPLLHQRRLPDRDEIAGQNAAQEEGARPVATHECISTVGIDFRLETAGSERSHDFVLAWYFPNCYADQTQKQKAQAQTAPIRREGHAYENHFTDATAVARYLVQHRNDLLARSLAFQQAFDDSSLPEVIRDQVMVHLNTLCASSWFTQAGDFGIQEGWTSDKSWGPLATIDVGMYGSITQAFLFPELDRAMLDCHRRLQFGSGDVVHGFDRNFASGDKAETVHSRVDLAPQYVLMQLRHAFINDDRAYLRDVWPSVRKALEYTLERRDADGDGMPEMAGTMSTYDNFPMWGPASLIVSQVIAALDHAVAAARMLDDRAAEQRYAAARDKARAGMEETLWNGSYFVLFNDVHGEHGRDDGCLSDQIIGQWAQDQVGLGPICDPAKIRTALETILARNHVPGEGLYNCRWPEDVWLHPVADSCWFDQANTFWTGVELAFASFLIYQGFVEEGFALTEAVDRRYRKAGRAWDHQEWGGHYYRAMAAWGILNASLGFSARGGRMRFAPRLTGDVRLFFAVGGAFGHYRRAGDRITISLVQGAIRVEELRLGIQADALTCDGQALQQQDGDWVLDGERQLTPDAPISIQVA